MKKGTWQPKKRRHQRVHGFLRRMASKSGINVIQRRRRKGRSTLSA